MISLKTADITRQFFKFGDTDSTKSIFTIYNAF